MIIVINAFSAKMGGGQTYLKNILHWLPTDKNLSIYLFAPNDLELPKDSRIKRPTTAWPTTNPYLRAIWERVLLPTFLRKVNANVLFCPGGVVTSKVPLNCKVVTMFRNMIPFDPDVIKKVPYGMQRIRNMLLRRLMLKSMFSADLTIFISEYARKIIEKLGPVPNAVVIPHGISNTFRSYKLTLNRPDWLPENYLLYVSRFDVYKNHMNVVEAYSCLPLHLQEKFSLVLVGEDDMPEAVRVKNRIAQLNLNNRVLVAGKVNYSDLPSVYKYANLIIFASSCENCPNILLESLGAGRPVISSNVMPMPEFGGKAVEYFSPFDPKDICKRMRDVLEDEIYSQKLSSEAVEKSKEYDWESTAKETWLNIYKTAEH